MAYILSEVGQSFNVPVHTYEADTEEDMNSVDIQGVPMGSKCHIINNGKWYMLNSKSEWKIMPSGGSGNSGIETGGGDSADSVIDKSVTSITSNAAEVGQYTFCGCEMLETASFPEATKIQGGAFVGCKALVSVSAPNVTEIRSDVTDYLHIDMDGNYNKDTIGAFSNCTSLETVDFPAAVTIGSSAFSGCTNLTTANFPAAVTIEDRAFGDCAGLTNLKFPRVKTIGASGGTGDMGAIM